MIKGSATVSLAISVGPEGPQGDTGSLQTTETNATLRALFTDTPDAGATVAVQASRIAYMFDPLDVVSPDNGVSVIVDDLGRRWKALAPAPASKAEALAGVLNDVDMTPLRVLQGVTEGDWYRHPASGATGRTIPEKMSDALSVLDFGAALDGVTDDYPAFRAAYLAATPNQTIDAPLATAGAYLSADPRGSDGKAVDWRLRGNALRGPGIGDPATGAGTFGSFVSNPWLRAQDGYKRLDPWALPSPPGGAVLGDSWEYPTRGHNNAALKSITGTITNGSAVMTAVSDTTGVYPGDAILSAVSGWPAGTTAANAMRVVAVTSNTITFGPDAGNGTATATPWGGSTVAGAAFQIRRRHWYGGHYLGGDTGVGDSVDVHYELSNPVLNITGAAGVIAEYNLNSQANPAGISRALMITGGGHVQSRMIALDIQRGIGTRWEAGLSLRGGDIGAFINAQKPISIDATWLDTLDGDEKPLAYGIHFNNLAAAAGALLEGAQLQNAAPAIYLRRNTDSSPTGDFLSLNTATGASLARVNVDGRGYFRGVQIAAGFPLQLGTLVISGTPTANGYVTVLDENGNPIKLMTAA